MGALHLEGLAGADGADIWKRSVANPGMELFSLFRADGSPTTPHLCAKFPISFFSCVGPLFPSGFARGADWEVRKRFVAEALVAKAARIFRTENPQLPAPILAQSSQILRCPALQLERFAGRLCGVHKGRDRRVKNAATLHRSLKKKKTASVTDAKF